MTEASSMAGTYMLVTMIREHVDEFGTAPDGRLFRA